MVDIGRKAVRCVLISCLVQIDSNQLQLATFTENPAVNLHRCLWSFESHLTIARSLETKIHSFQSEFGFHLPRPAQRRSVDPRPPKELQLALILYRVD